MRYLVGAGSPRALNIQSACWLPTGDTKPALTTKQQKRRLNVQSQFSPNETRAGFKLTANHPTKRLYIQSVNEPAPTEPLHPIHLQRETL